MVRPGALIVGDGAARGALTAARALDAAGWRVGIGAPGGGGLAAASRAASAAHPVPPPADGLDSFAGTVADAVERMRYEVVFGAGDAEVLALSLLRARLGAVVPYAPHAIVVRALDKLALTEAARASGIGVPRTWATPDEALREHAGPVCVKARVHGPPDRTGAPARVAVSFASDVRTAAGEMAAIAARGADPLVQEVVRGRLIAFVTVVDGAGAPLAAVQQEASATWPPNAGVTARGRTVPVDRALAERVSALMAELGWRGLAQLQFIVPADGEPRLIDLNGRFYGSLALATGAGVNLPAIWAASATGRPPPAPATARPTRYQWLEGDLRRALGTPGARALRELAGCARYAAGARHSVASLRDPAPGLRLLRDGARRARARYRG